jgi:nicotinate (nicotinamide) nucleotide adenylyltransferase
MNQTLGRKPLFPSPKLYGTQNFWRGKRVGIFGGSFNPPHAGHRLIALEALHRFNLDCVWWMVSPQNPIKTTSSRNDFKERFDKTTDFVNHPKMVVTDIEYHLDTPYSYKTVLALKKTFPQTEFLWIAGMDNAALFHKWNHWQELVNEVPFAFFKRPPSRYKMHNNRLKMKRNLNHFYDIKNHNKPLGNTGIYWIYTGDSINISSTEIRRNKK